MTTYNFTIDVLYEVMLDERDSKPIVSDRLFLLKCFDANDVVMALTKHISLDNYELVPALSDVITLRYGAAIIKVILEADAVRFIRFYDEIVAEIEKEIADLKKESAMGDPESCPLEATHSDYNVYEDIIKNYLNGNRKDAAELFHDIGYDDTADFIVKAQETLGDRDTLEMLRVLYKIMGSW